MNIKLSIALTILMVATLSNAMQIDNDDSDNLTAAEGPSKIWDLRIILYQNRRSSNNSCIARDMTSEEKKFVGKTKGWVISVQLGGILN